MRKRVKSHVKPIYVSVRNWRAFLSDISPMFKGIEAASPISGYVDKFGYKLEGTWASEYRKYAKEHQIVIMS